MSALTRSYMEAVRKIGFTMASILAAISLSGNAVASLVPLSRGSEDGPGRRGCQQIGICAPCHPMFCGTFLKYALHDRDDGTFERHFGQLAWAAGGLG